MNSHFQKDCIEILKERAARGQISRRQMLQGAAALMGSSALGLGAGAAQAAENKLVFVNWGGDALDAMDTAFGKPFTKETGIKVLYDGAGPTEGAITAQVQGGHPSWDMVDADPFTSEGLGRKGLMTPIDYDIVDPEKQRPGFQWKYSSSCYFYSYVIAYDSTVYDTAPSTLKDFFNTDKFPGKRSMYKWGAGMWEAALLADGVDPKDLYPLDLDRAHAKIKAFKEHIGAFWSGGAESQSLLLNGDVSMALIWNTRAMLLQKDTEGDISFTFNDGIVGPGGIGVLKNNPGGTEAAMKYIAATQVPERQAKLFELMGNGPSNPAADALVSEEMQHLNPMDPSNLPRQTPLDTDWYADNYSAALSQYLQIISA